LGHVVEGADDGEASVCQVGCACQIEVLESLQATELFDAFIGQLLLPQHVHLLQGPDLSEAEQVGIRCGGGLAPELEGFQRGTCHKAGQPVHRVVYP